MNLSVLIPKLRPVFARHPEILAVYLFGSMAKGKARRCREMDLSSDLDLGVLLSPRISREKRSSLGERLSAQLNSCVRHPDADLVVLNDASAGIAHEILRTGRRIYERAGRRHRSEEAGLLIAALDFLPTKEWVENRIIEKMKSNRG